MVLHCDSYYIIDILEYAIGKNRSTQTDRHKEDKRRDPRLELAYLINGFSKLNKEFFSYDTNQGYFSIINGEFSENRNIISCNLGCLT